MHGPVCEADIQHAIKAPEHATRCKTVSNMPAAALNTAQCMHPKRRSLSQERLLLQGYDRPTRSQVCQSLGSPQKYFSHEIDPEKCSLFFPFHFAKCARRGMHMNVEAHPLRGEGPWGRPMAELKQ